MLTIKTNEANFVCPFFRREKQLWIECEGFMPGWVNRHTWPDWASKRRYQAKCCESHDYAQHCHLAATLMRKYSKEEEKQHALQTGDSGPAAGTE